MNLYDEERRAKDEAWIADRPECVRQIARRFPIRSILNLPDRYRFPMHVIGYTEEDHLIVTPYDPLENAELAYLVREYIAVADLEGVEIQRRS